MSTDVFLPNVGGWWQRQAAEIVAALLDAGCSSADADAIAARIGAALVDLPKALAAVPALTEPVTIAGCQAVFTVLMHELVKAHVRLHVLGEPA